MKIFGQNLKILSNRIIWAPIDREKSIFEKKMSRSPFLTTQNTSFSKIHNFCKVQLFSKRFSDYDREFPVLFYKNKKNFWSTRGFPFFDLSHGNRLLERYYMHDFFGTWLKKWVLKSSIRKSLVDILLRVQNQKILSILCQNS